MQREAKNQKMVTEKIKIRLKSALIIICIIITTSIAKYAYAEDVAVIIGVSDYHSDNNTDLKYADEDARLFAEMLKTALGVKQQDILLLTSHPKKGEQESTAENINKALSLATSQKFQANPGLSRFILYYSGHSYQYDDNQYMITSTDFNVGNPTGKYCQYLTSTEIKKILMKSKSKMIWSIYDMCRNKDEVPTTGVLNKQFLPSPTWPSQQIVTMFSSSKSSSYESPSLKHGYFTYYLCQGLTPRKNDQTTIIPALKNHRVLIEDLFEYALDKTQLETSDLLITWDSHSESTKSSDGKPHQSGLLGQLPEIYGDPQSIKHILGEYNPDEYQAEITPDQKFNVYWQDGRQALKDGKLAKAIDFFTSAFEAKPVSRVANAIASTNHDLGNYSLAEEWSLKALSLNKKDLNAMYRLGDLYNSHFKGREIEAERYFREILLQQEDANVYHQLGLIAASRSDYTTGINWLKKALDMSPQDVHLMRHMALIYTERREYCIANAYMTQGKSYNPNFYLRLDKSYKTLLSAEKFDIEQAQTLLLYMWGADKYKGEIKELITRLKELKTNAEAMSAVASYLYFYEKDYSQAEKICLDLIKANPDNTKILQLLGEIYFAENKADEAESCYKQIIKNQPGSFLYFTRLADIYQYIRKDRKSAEAFYRKHVESEPDCPYGYMQLGNFLAQESATKDVAEQYFRTAVLKDSKNTIIKLALIDYLESVGKTQDIGNIYKQQLEIDPVNARLILSYANYLKENPATFIEAEKYFQQGLELDPDDASSITDYGQFIAYRKRDLKKGEDILRKAVAKSPKASYPQRALAHFYKSVKKYMESARIYGELVKSNPEDEDFFTEYMEILQKIGNTIEEEIQLKMKINSNPNNASYQHKYAIFLHNTKDRKSEAAGYYERAMTLDPENPRVYSNYGLLLRYVLNNLEKSEKLLQTALIKSKNNRYDTFILLDLYLNQDRVKESAELIDRVSANEFLDVDMINKLAAGLRNQNKFDTGKQLFIAVLEKHPDNPDLLLQYLYYTEKKDEAKILNQLKKISRQNPEALRVIGGYTFYTLKKHSEGLKYMTEYLAKVPQSKQNEETLGSMYLYDKKYDKALEWLLKSGSIEDKEALILEHIAECYHNLNKIDEARFYYQLAINVGPPYKESITNYLYVLNRAGDSELREIIMKTGIERFPDEIDLRLNLAQHFYQNKRFAEAKSILDDSIKHLPKEAKPHAELALILLELKKKNEAYNEAKIAKSMGLKNHGVFSKLGIK